MSKKVIVGILLRRLNEVWMQDSLEITGLNEVNRKIIRRAECP